MTVGFKRKRPRASATRPGGQFVMAREHWIGVGADGKMEAARLDTATTGRMRRGGGEGVDRVEKRTASGTSRKQ
jgi:hypothetical protein